MQVENKKPIFSVSLSDEECKQGYQLYDISYENNVDILASEYVRPKPLTGYTPTRNEIGDRSGTKVLPQTHIPSQQVPIQSHNLSPF